MNKLYYKQLPDELYVLGSIENGEIDMESENDINGNQWICAWSHKEDCEDFKKKLNYQRPVSLIPKKYLSSILYNANIDNKLPVTISFLYFNPSVSNISSEKTINDTGERNVIDVVSDNYYLVEIEEEQDRLISKINQKIEEFGVGSHSDYSEFSEKVASHVESMQKEIDATEETIVNSKKIRVKDAKTNQILSEKMSSGNTDSIKNKKNFLGKLEYVVCSIIGFLLLVVFLSLGLGMESSTSTFTGVIVLLLGVAFFSISNECKKEHDNEIEQQNIAIESQRNKQIKLIENIVRKHISTLAVKQKQLTRFDDYGNEDTNAWDKELDYFIDNVVYTDPSVDASIVDRFEVYGIIHGEIYSYHLDAEVDSDFIDNMTGYEYEIFCENMLDQAGWDCKLTKSSGDQGVDIIAKKDGTTLAIQCKKYTNPVGNKAVQEVYSGKKFYGADYAIVVSNSTYTQSAKQLANNLNVILAHHDDLKDIEM